MREGIKCLGAAAAFAAICTFLYSANVGAEFRFYNHTVKFASSVPARVDAKAFESIDLTVVGNRQELSALYLPDPLDPRLQYIAQPTQEIVAEYMNQDMTSVVATPSPQTTSTLRIPGLAPGKYRVRLMYPKGEMFDTREIMVTGTGNPVVVTSMGVNGPNQFALSWFATAPSSSPQASTPFPGVEDRRRFGAWMATADAPKDTVPLYWLSFTIGRSTLQYYTVDEPTKNMLRNAGWFDNGVFLRVLRDTGGTCPAGSEPVYRAFRPAKVGLWEPTHRYTADPTAYRNWLQSGNWAGEGVAFCGRVVTEPLAETLSANG
jgi:hypothetical protein